ncbi:MAG: hypothetical protein GEU91_15460 [Rhizobiales bacterium]|nr:hypothetical protein [Hyphomicrobiales bacterium]
MSSWSVEAPARGGGGVLRSDVRSPHTETLHEPWESAQARPSEFDTNARHEQMTERKIDKQLIAILSSRPT